MQIVTLFIDTNGFIQLRDLKDLKWGDLFPGVKHVRIMVARAVIAELDEFKSSTNARRRDRSRLALKLIDKASNEADRALILKNRPLKVTLEIAPRARPDWSLLAELDPNSPDDQLVAATITYGNEAAIFSHDSGPRISARDADLAAYEPPEDWLLPVEQSDEQRKIGLLERQLKQALTTKPELAITIDGRNSAGKLKLYRPRLPALDSISVEKFVSSYLVEYPKASLSVMPASMIYVTGYGVTEMDQANYNSEYRNFEERVRKFFQTFHESLPVFLSPPVVHLKIANIGSVSATDFHVSIETSGEFSIVHKPGHIRKKCPFPMPPDKPRSRDPLNPFRHGLISPPKIPHPTEIMWIDKPTFRDTFGSFGCKDFRPKREDVTELGLWSDNPLPVVGLLSVTAGANDISDLNQEVEVSLENREANWTDAKVVESLPEFLRSEFDR